MKYYLVTCLLLAGLCTGCSSSKVTTNQITNRLPLEFWGIGTFHFAQAEQIAYGDDGVGKVKLHFKATEYEHYSVNGTVTYDTSGLSCSYNIEPHPTICAEPSCDITGTTDGVLTGTADYDDYYDQGLTVRLTWLDKQYPNEHLHISCGSADAAPMNNNLNFLQQVMQADDGFVKHSWTIDMADAQFIDDLSTNTVTDVKTATIDFNVSVSNLATGTGSFALYRNEPQ